jgi:hypothetical protein
MARTDGVNHTVRRVAWCVLVVIAVTPRARAQDRPFVFSLTTTAPEAKTQVRVDVDLGTGEGAFHGSDASGPEQRIGVQVSTGRFTVVGRVDVATSATAAYGTSQSGEVLVSFAPRRVVIAAGGGVLHEARGVNVLLARVVATRESELWRVNGNVLLQKPVGVPGRDAVDLLTTIGWARRINATVSLGVEAIGEDLEGFWEQAEAEGGARLLAGPSLHVAPRRRTWQLTATGGPTFHPSDTGQISGAPRDLPRTTKRLGYAFRTAIAVGF